MTSMKRPPIIVQLLFLSGILLGVSGAFVFEIFMSSNSSADDPSLKNGNSQPKEIEHSTGLESQGDTSIHMERLEEILDASHDKNSVELKATVLSFVADAPQSSVGALLELLTEESFRTLDTRKARASKGTLGKISYNSSSRSIRFRSGT